MKANKAKSIRNRKQRLTEPVCEGDNSFFRRNIFHLSEDEATQQAKQQLQKCSEVNHQVSETELSNIKFHTNAASQTSLNHARSEGPSPGKQQGWGQSHENWLGCIGWQKQPLKRGRMNTEFSVGIKQHQTHANKTMVGFLRNQAKKTTGCLSKCEVLISRKGIISSGQTDEHRRPHSWKLKCSEEAKKGSEAEKGKKNISHIVSVIPWLVEQKGGGKEGFKGWAAGLSSGSTRKVHSCLINSTYLQPPFPSNKTRNTRKRGLSHYSGNSQCIHRMGQEKDNIFNFTKSKINRPNTDHKEQADHSLTALTKNTGAKRVYRQGKFDQAVPQDGSKGEGADDQRNSHLKRQFERLRKLLNKETSKPSQFDLSHSPIQIRKL